MRMVTTFEEYEAVDLFADWDAKTQPIINIINLRKWFPVSQQSVLFSRVVAQIKAVDGVNFSLNEGETLGIAGESGCGKSITCLSIMKLVPFPGRILEGSKVMFEGENLAEKPEEEEETGPDSDD